MLASADSSGVKGPGDTLTFQAFIATDGLGEESTGHVNLIDRNGDAASGVHCKGDVNCTFLVADGTGGGYVELYGVATAKDGTERDFVVRIRDNGQGERQHRPRRVRPHRARDVR